MDTPFVRAVPARDPLIGRTLHDRYRVEKRIGKGGMGIVYLAEHVLLRRKVALKTISDRAFASEEQVARFHREAVAAAAVGNAHIVDVTDMGLLDDGSYFIVLEYLDGVELGFAVGAAGTFPVARAVHIVSQLCDALSAVHAAGIVHRDLKPENLFLVEREGAPDFVKVLDFGVCKVFEDQAPGDRPLTRTNASLGTPQFMAPEQIDGSEWADQRADIYAAGAILYFALTGEAPFESPSLPQLFMRVSMEPPPSLLIMRPDLPPALDAVIARALQKKPEDRYQTSAELRAALQPFASLQTDAPAARRVAQPAADRAPTLAYSVPVRESWWPRSARAYAAGVALLCFVVALVVAWSSGGLWRDGDAQRSSVRAAAAAPASANNNTSQPAAVAPAVDVVPPSHEPAHEPAVAGDAEPRSATAQKPGEPVTPERRVRRAHRAVPAPPDPAPPDPVQAPASAAEQDVEPARVPTPGVDQPAATPTPTPTPTPTNNAYRLSQRGLKDVFQ